MLQQIRWAVEKIKGENTSDPSEPAQVATMAVLTLLTVMTATTVMRRALRTITPNYTAAPIVPAGELGAF
jgi:hypothetical protein